MKEKESDEGPYARDPSHPSSPPGPCSEQNVTFPKSWTEFSKVADENKKEHDTEFIFQICPEGL